MVTTTYAQHKTTTQHTLYVVLWSCVAILVGHIPPSKRVCCYTCCGLVLIIYRYWFCEGMIIVILPIGLMIRGCIECIKCCKRKKQERDERANAEKETVADYTPPPNYYGST